MHNNALDGVQLTHQPTQSYFLNYAFVNIKGIYDDVYDQLD